MAKKLGQENTIKLVTILQEHKEFLGNGSKTIKDIQNFLDRTVDFEIPESALRSILKTLNFDVKIRRTNQNPGSADRLRLLTTLVNRMFHDLETELELTIGEKCGTKKALMALAAGRATDEIRDMLK